MSTFFDLRSMTLCALLILFTFAVRRRRHDNTPSSAGKCTETEKVGDKLEFLSPGLLQPSSFMITAIGDCFATSKWLHFDASRE